MTLQFSHMHHAPCKLTMSSFSFSFSFDDTYIELCNVAECCSATADPSQAARGCLLLLLYNEIAVCLEMQMLNGVMPVQDICPALHQGSLHLRHSLEQAHCLGLAPAK